MKQLRIALTATALTAATLGSRTVQRTPSPVIAGTAADTIIALERAALDRWGRGDPRGYIETFAQDITYFDPFTERRIDGVDAMKAMLEPLVGKIKVDRYEMLNARVQQGGAGGAVAVLSFNLVSHTRDSHGSPTSVRWNSTEVYQRTAGKWKIIHSHWSFTTPQLKQPTPP